MGVAQALVRWLEQGGVPPSVILLHGLHWARSPESDGLPVDTYRPQLKMQGTDSKAITEIMDAMAHPQAVKTRVIETWPQSNWVNKTAGTRGVFSTQTVRKTPTTRNKPSLPPKKAQGFVSTKPVIVVKKKRETGIGTI